ncbi:WD repeat domain-containing protein [Colletotrichum paranaense]|uniref:WD repeat domain-containing protein n=1 Tax=Colletotrichum paranaense TaxID=1914294 RepID=A0ABQ9T066_9PEZI|nr:WD repeat domain-containing protein [Colletotrichum paranaense]KAK1545164.1 WD repeat domain-containing protein [Colletotrichum paranaense]
MSWQVVPGMGSNVGNGMGGPGGNEMGGAMQGNGGNQPHATEYTLQGVMRFLQTEWHRHERDRNAWEIDRQEMKARIASLEGQARRADATQKALKKYVAILEKKVKDQAAQLKGGAKAGEDAANAEKDRAALVQEKLRPSSKKPFDAHGGDLDVDKADDESQRADLKSFLDQCQAEFTYLMITPANPLPPRDSPPLPILEDLREGEPFGVPGGKPFQEPPFPFASSSLVPQNHVREANRPPPAPNHAPPMQRSQPTSFQVKPVDQQQQQQLQQQQQQHQQPQQQHQQQMPPPAQEPAPPVMYAAGTEWPQPMSATGRMLDDNMQRPSHAVESISSVEPTEESQPSRPAPETDGWDFSDGSFADANSSQSLQHITNRPDTDVFPTADNLPKSPNRGPSSHRRKGSMSRRRSADHELSLNSAAQKAETGNFKLRFGLRGHLDTVRTVIFSGGGSPGEPEICTAGDDGMIKRFHIPRADNHGQTNAASDLDVTANFSHRGHAGGVLCLTSWSPSPNFSTGGRAQGDGWIFSGGQDATIRVWERGRVDPKATLEGHTDAVWALCVLPTTLGAVFGQNSQYGSPDRILLVSGGADGSVRLWSVSAPPQLTSPQPGTNRAGPTGSRGRVRGNSMSSGSAFSSTPQPNMASSSPFNHTLVHNIKRPDGSDASPTCITSLSPSGDTFVVSYSDAAILVYDTRTGEQTGTMDSSETYDGSINTSVNAVVATTVGLEQPQGGLSEEDGSAGGGPTGGGGRSMAGSGVEGVIISGHEDRFVRFFDANSGQCTYNMLAHPASISGLSLSPDGRELVSAGHDASLRFWSLEKRSCTQEITSHRIMRGEGVCSVVWSQDGKWVVSGGGDGVVKVFAR